MVGKASLFTSTVSILTAAVSGFAQWDPIFNDGKFHPIWNKQDFSNWMEHSSNWGIGFPGTDSATIELDGQSPPGDKTHLIYGRKISGNMEAKVVMRMPTTGGALSGFIFRAQCRSPTGTLENSCGTTPYPSQVCGPRVDFGQTYSGGIQNNCVGAYVTTSSTSYPPKKINNMDICRDTANFKSVDVWNEYGVRVFNDTAWTFINGIMCTKYFLERESEKQATTQGLIAMEYLTQRKVEFKDIELRNSDIDSIPTALPARPGASGFAVWGVAGSVSYQVPVAGKFSVRIADMRGKVVKTHTGTGPVAHANLPLGTSGLFLAEIRSSGGSFTTKFMAD